MQGPTTAVLVRLLCQLKQEIVGIARRNRRTTTEEIRIALENHVAACRKQAS
jgi:hypothetical protein